jgi:hypothetical protein
MRWMRRVDVWHDPDSLDNPDTWITSPAEEKRRAAGRAACATAPASLSF